MAHVAITIEGGLFSADLLEQLGSRPEEVPGQRPADFDLDGSRLSEEIQATFSDVQRQWQTFEGRRARHQGSATTLTRDLWMLPVLGLLGFDLTYQRAALQAGGGNFTISHLAGDEEGAPPVHIVAHEQNLDRRGDARQSPHALVQDYLNRSDSLWGVVTNGKELRLLRNSKRFARPTYAEFNLEAMVAGNLYSEFVPLFRLAHRTRLPMGMADAHECWLERYYQQGIADGGRVRERLSEGVYQALLALGGGFLAHPDSTKLREAFQTGRIDEAEYYRQLLRLVYRLLFLMVAEERRLLLVPDHENAGHQRIYTDWYSIMRLRQLAERRFTSDRHSDLFEGLKHTFLLFRDERHASMLGLTALDGDLFGGHACYNLETAACRNDDLLRALFHLSTFEDTPEGRGRAKKRGVRRRVNYAGLDVEEFGSVYEGLLEYHPQVEREHWTFDLVAGSERKQTGSYYTPHALVMELIDSALVPVMEERLAKAKTPEEEERALLDLKVVDPAAGSGHFLLAAARRIGKELARVRTGEPEPAPEAQRAAIRDVVRHCLYAVDKNPLAVDLCKVALWIEGHNTGRPLSFLDHHVKLGDSLIGVFDLKVLEKGIPDDAYKPFTGDDKDVARDLKRRNRQEQQGQETLGLFGTENLAAAEAGIARAARELEAFEDESPATVHEKGRRYHEFRELHPDFRRLRQACDLWTAAFFARLRKPASGEPERIPTTDHVLRVLRNQPGTQGVMKTALELAHEHRFFHWPLEFAEVFAGGGFDVALGNPPWERIKLQEQEFFASRSPEIAKAPNKATRDRLINALGSPDASPAERALKREFEQAQHEAEAAGQFIRTGTRYPLTGTGDVNTYAVFAETFLNLFAPKGRAGFIVPTGIATDNTTKAFFEEVSTKGRLASLIDFENRDAIFPGVHRSYRFSLLTLAQDVQQAGFIFFATNIEQLTDRRRRFNLSPEDILRINPNTKTAAVFRSDADAELTKKIYARVPVLIDDNKGDAGNPWGAFYLRLVHYGDHGSELFTAERCMTEDFTQKGNTWRKSHTTLLPVYESKMVHAYDNRYATFEEGGQTKALTDMEKGSDRAVVTRYWVSEEFFQDLMKKYEYRKQWFIGYRDIARSNDIRTIVAMAFPRMPASVNLPVLGFRDVVDGWLILTNMNSIVFDFVARQSISGAHVTFFILKQLPFLPPMAYLLDDRDFIVSRVLELTYTSEDMGPFAEDLGYEGPPFRWDPERRAQLRAELDAYYAYLYRLSKKELRYILDPKDVMGEDYPSETFRVLKEREIKEHGEYRTQRLVLEAYNRFATDGTFDASRLEDPEYFPVVRQALAVSKSREQELERTLKELVDRTDQAPLPTLFVEGSTDKLIVEGAWRALYPDEPLPVSILPAGGTMQMRSLAAPGKAMRELLGERLVMAFADNDAEGRALWDEGNLHKGGVWKPQTNGVHWCLLRPSEEFQAVMEHFQVPRGCWPFTVENAFPAALRREAMAAGAYAISDKVQSDLIRDPEVTQRVFAGLRGLGEADDPYVYLMAPTPEAKDTFAAWVTDPTRLTADNFAAFEIVLSRLKDLLARQGQPPDQRQSA